MNEYIENLYGFVASDIIDDYLKRGIKDIKSSTEFNSYSYSDYTKKYIPLIVDVDILTTGNKSNSYLKEMETYDINDSPSLLSTCNAKFKYHNYLCQFLCMYPEYKNKIILRKLKSKSIEEDGAFTIIYPNVVHAIVVDYNTMKFVVLRYGARCQNKLGKYSLDDILYKHPIMHELSFTSKTIIYPFKNYQPKQEEK